jgi:hypothetical protein
MRKQVKLRTHFISGRRLKQIYFSWSWEGGSGYTVLWLYHTPRNNNEIQYVARIILDDNKDTMYKPPIILNWKEL